jgi:hypothetical protein
MGSGSHAGGLREWRSVKTAVKEEANLSTETLAALGQSVTGKGGGGDMMESVHAGSAWVTKLIRMEQPTDQGWMSALEAAEWHRSRSIEHEVLRRDVLV